MATANVNGVELYYEREGSGDSLILVHGSWGDADNWRFVVPALSERYNVVTYDRRGHSRSERPPGQGSIREDVADLAALIEELDLAPVYVVGSSFGAIISLRLAATRPELIRALLIHEPPLFPLLAGGDAAPMLDQVLRRVGGVVRLLEAGDMEAGARDFVETIAFGPGAWEAMPAEARGVFVNNAPTFLDEARDPEALMLDLGSLSGFDHPAMVTTAADSLPHFPAVVDLVADALPGARRETFESGGHVPHLLTPDAYAETVTSFGAA